jgi:hypothetical protein
MIARGRRWMQRRLQVSASRIDPSQISRQTRQACDWKAVPMTTTTTKTTAMARLVVETQWRKQTLSSLLSPLVRSLQQRWHNGTATDSVVEAAVPKRHNPQSLRVATVRNWSRRMGLAEMDAARAYIQKTFLSCADWSDAYAWCDWDIRRP